MGGKGGAGGGRSAGDRRVAAGGRRSTGAGATAGAGGAERPGRGGVSAPTVREYRRRVKATSHTGRLLRRIVVAILLVFALGAALVYTYFSPLFTITTIKVENAARLTNEHITELAAIPDGTTLLRVDLESIRLRLATDPWVESVDVKRAFPSTIVVSIREREIAAVVEVPPETSTATVSRWLITADGVWLGKLGDGSAGQAAEGAAGGGSGADGGGTAGGDAAAGTGGNATGDAAAGDAAAGGDAGGGAAAGDAPTGNGGTDAGQAQDTPGTQGQGSGQAPPATPSLVAGVNLTAADLVGLPSVKKVAHTVVPKVGERTKDEGILNALAILNGFSPTMRALVESIDAPDRVKTMLTLTNHVNVAFGVAEDIEAKEQAILGLLDKYAGSLTYINVRVADRPSIRAAITE